MGLATDPRAQAFKVFDIADQNEFGAKEIRCVMQVICVRGRERVSVCKEKGRRRHDVRMFFSARYV
jgi:hypothetical protein